jgi:hypothetical protein
MQKWIAFYTNDGADGSDESDWGIFDTPESAALFLERWRETLNLDGLRLGVELVECPDAWLQIQLYANYENTNADDEHFWPIPNWGA